MAKGGKGRKRLNKKQIIDKLQDFFLENPEKQHSFKEIFRALRLDTHPAKMLAVDVMEEMAWDDFLVRKGESAYQLNQNGQVQEGTFQRKANGKNTIVPDDGAAPIFVAERNSMFALTGDKVQFTIMARRKNHIREAMVTKILQRAKDTFVGKLRVERDFAFLVSDGNIFVNDVIIPKRKLKGGKTNDKAVVKITQWPSKENKSMIGEVVDVLGETGDNDVEMNSILAQYGLPYKYPKAVEDAANKIDPTITEQDYKEREDFRDVTTFTIDPHDAKDFDDALSIRRLDDGNWEVGVHIADVSHYVHEGDIIDREAEKRATSVYLVDRTIPMLPERLCNFICSLRPDEEKLAYSTIFVLNEKAEIVRWHLTHTVIRSNRRFTYEEVQNILERNNEASKEDLALPGEHPEPLPEGAPLEGEYAEELIKLNQLAKKLRAARFKNGAIGFERSEVRFEVDEKGHPISTYVKVAKDANKLVEEFMLLANRSVAEMIGKQPKGKKPKVLPYRIHDVPDPEKLEKLRAFIAKFGYKVRTEGSKTDISKSINHLLEDVKGKKEENAVEIVALRAMMKARYSVHNIGHYGLMFQYYTHFTSPIRRYPDTMVHRLLTRYAEGGRSVSATKYEDLCEHASNMEQLAATAERASIKYKQVEFMGDRVGQEFDGSISGVTEFGLYVELTENMCEGMIPLRSLLDDYYEFDERNYCLVGRRYHKCYALGDKVRVKVDRANLERRQLDFALVSDESETMEQRQRAGKNNQDKTEEGKADKKKGRGKRGGRSKRHGGK